MNKTKITLLIFSIDLSWKKRKIESIQGVFSQDYQMNISIEPKQLCIPRLDVVAITLKEKDKQQVEIK